MIAGSCAGVELRVDSDAVRGRGVEDRLEHAVAVEIVGVADRPHRRRQTPRPDAASALQLLVHPGVAAAQDVLGILGEQIREARGADQSRCCRLARPRCAS